MSVKAGSLRLRALIGWEWRMMARSRAVRGLLAAWVLFLIAAAGFGSARLHHYRADLAQVRGAAEHERAALERQLANHDRIAEMPLSINATILIPPAPLMDVVAGRSALEPASSEVNMWTLSHLIFRNYQTANARVLGLGVVDLGFAILYLLPVMVVLLGYSVLMYERRGSLGLMLRARGINLTHLLWARLTARICLVVLPVLLVLSEMFFSQSEAADRVLPLIGIVVATTVYAAVWMAATACCAARIASETRALLTLFVAWIATALLIPAAIGAAARASYPLPSRLDTLMEARRAEVQAYQRQNELLRAYADKHDGVRLIDSETAPLWQKGVVVVTEAIERATLSARHRFDAEFTSQIHLIGLLQYLSPTLVAERALGRLARTDETRFLEVHRQASEYLQELKTYLATLTFADRPLTVAQLRSTPTFAVREPNSTEPLLSMLGPICWLMLLAAGIGAAARVRLSSSPR